MDAKIDGPKSGYRALVISMSLVIALLAANPFSDAVGFPPLEDRSPTPAIFRIIGGVVLFFAVKAFLEFLIGLVRDVVARLGTTAAKPDRWIALAALVCGTICLLAALQGAFAATQSGGVSMAPTMSFNTSPGNPGASLNVQARSQGSPGLTLISLLTFLAGAGLLAFGVWGSLKPAAIAPPSSPVAKPEGWGEPMIDAARV